MKKRIIVIISIILLLVLAALCIIFCFCNKSQPVNKQGKILPIFEEYMYQRGWDGKWTGKIPEIKHNRHFELMDDVKSIELVTPYRETIPMRWVYNTDGLGYSRLSIISYKEDILKKKINLKTKYSDSMLVGDNETINRKLASCSMTASALAYEKDKAISFLKECGYSCKLYWNNGREGDVHHVSFIIGHKVIDNKTVIAVWIRGTQSHFEWESNFEIGKGTTHYGFWQAKKEMAQKVESYIKDNNITGRLKFWITGHSRGAAVANLYAKDLSSVYDKSNIYAYTFATPRVSTKAKKEGYKFIHNYLNNTDFVTELAPAKWGYKRYGEDIVISPDKKSAQALKRVDSDLLKGFSKEESRDLIDSFLDYAGDGVESYYRGYKILFVKLESPATVFKRVVSVATSKNATLDKLKNILPDVFKSGDIDSAKVFYKLWYKMDKLQRTHCPTTYYVLMNY